MKIFVNLRTSFASILKPLGLIFFATLFVLSFNVKAAELKFICYQDINECDTIAEMAKSWESSTGNSVNIETVSRAIKLFRQYEGKSNGYLWNNLNLLMALLTKINYYERIYYVYNIIIITKLMEEKWKYLLI